MKGKFKTPAGVLCIVYAIASVAVTIIRMLNSGVETWQILSLDMLLKQLPTIFVLLQGVYILRSDIPAKERQTENHVVVIVCAAISWAYGATEGNLNFPALLSILILCVNLLVEKNDGIKKVTKILWFVPGGWVAVNFVIRLFSGVSFHPMALLGYAVSVINILVLLAVCAWSAVFVKPESQNQNAKSSKTVIVLIVILAALMLFFNSGAGLSGCSSSGGGNKPWKELGVSEREYNRVYNFYKYGEWS